MSSGEYPEPREGLVMEPVALRFEGESLEDALTRLGKEIVRRAMQECGGDLDQALVKLDAFTNPTQINRFLRGDRISVQLVDELDF